MVKVDTLEYVEVRNDGAFWKAQEVKASSGGIKLDCPKAWIKSDTITPVRR
jgi:hypothetical protein